MTTAIDLATTLLPPDAQREVRTFCGAVETDLGDGLVGIALFGSGARDDFRPNRSDVNLLVVVRELAPEVMRSLLEPVGRARRVGIAPVLLTETELAASTDIFPVKFLAMKQSHRRLVGRDVLGALPIGREHVRLRCEQELMELLLTLRDHYFDDAKSLGGVMAGTVGRLLDVLRMALTLTGEGLLSRREVPEAAARRMGLDAAALQSAVALRDAPELPREKALSLFERYLDLVSRAARFVDSLEERRG
jgi:predicted nucleotidyltransferase